MHNTYKHLLCHLIPTHSCRGTHCPLEWHFFPACHQIPFNAKKRCGWLPTRSHCQTVFYSLLIHSFIHFLTGLPTCSFCFCMISQTPDLIAVLSEKASIIFMAYCFKKTKKLSENKARAVAEEKKSTTHSLSKNKCFSLPRKWINNQQGHL